MRIYALFVKYWSTNSTFLRKSTPCEGADIPGYYSEAKDATRQAVNKWIRTSGAFDGVIDFDAIVRDPDHPARLLPRFASKDHLHLNDDGYKAMADSIDLKLFE